MTSGRARPRVVKEAVTGDWRRFSHASTGARGASMAIRVEGERLYEPGDGVPGWWRVLLALVGHDVCEAQFSKRGLMGGDSRERVCVDRSSIALKIR